MVHYMVSGDVHDRCIFSAIFHSIGKRLMKRSMQVFCLLWFPLYSRCCFARLVHFAHYCSGAKPVLRIFFIVLVPSLASAFCHLAFPNNPQLIHSQRLSFDQSSYLFSYLKYVLKQMQTSIERYF